MRPLATILLECALVAVLAAAGSDAVMIAWVAAQTRLFPGRPINYARAGWASVAVAAALLHLALELVGANRYWCLSAFPAPATQG